MLGKCVGRRQVGSARCFRKLPPSLRVVCVENLGKETNTQQFPKLKSHCSTGVELSLYLD